MWNKGNVAEVMKDLGLILVMFILVLFALYIHISFEAFLDERQDTKEEIKVDVVDELKTIYDTEDVRILDEIKDNNEYVRYELFVEDTTKQAIYFKDTLEIKIIE